jgi:hypothetical protein
MSKSYHILTLHNDVKMTRATGKGNVAQRVQAVTEGIGAKRSLIIMKCFSRYFQRLLKPEA